MSNPPDPALSAGRIHLCFAAKTIVHENEEGADQRETIELVRRGQVLATLVRNDPSSAAASAAGGKDSPVKEIILLPGQNTELSPKGDSLLATRAGYPQVVRTQGQQEHTLVVSVTPLIAVTPDQMEVSLTLYPPVPGTPPLGIAEIDEVLAEEGVCYGLNRQILLDSLERSRVEQQVVSGVLIAMGLRPIAGADAHLRFEVEMGSIPGKILGDGRIDFHERRMFISVCKGQLIAVKVPSSSGSPGINVSGQPIAQKEGRDIKIGAGENVLYDEKSGELRAARGGVLSVVQNTVKVSSKLTISGDINFTTGNITASDAVDIGGSVQPGFQVNAQGNLLINGGVRSATVISQSNVQVKEGVSGKQSVLRAAGDLDLLFVEQATIHGGGNVILRKNAYYCRIFAGGDILCPEDSRILGGIVVAGGNLRVGQVGSDNAAPALIAAGTDGRQYLRYEALRQEIQEKEEELEHCLHLHGHNSQLPFHLSMTEELEEMHSDLQKLNLATDKRADSPSELVAKLRSRTIIVQGLIYAGTQLRIGNVTTELQTPLSAIKFTLSEDLQKIVATPL